MTIQHTILAPESALGHYRHEISSKEADIGDDLCLSVLCIKDVAKVSGELVQADLSGLGAVRQGLDRSADLSQLGAEATDGAQDAVDVGGSRRRWPRRSERGCCAGGIAFSSVAVFLFRHFVCRPAQPSCKDCVAGAHVGPQSH